MNILLILFSFGLGFSIGGLLIYRLTLKKAVLPASLPVQAVPLAPPPPIDPPETESAVLQKLRSDTMERKILYEEELSLIFKMGQEMFSSVNLESITRSIAENANKIIGAEIVTLMLLDKASDCFIPVYYQGVLSEQINQIRLKKGEGITGWVALRNEHYINNNIENDIWFKGQNKGEYFVNTLVSFPLATKEQVIGVLHLSNKKNRQPFGNDDLSFLRGMCTEASIALQNANLYEQLQESYLKTISALAFALDSRDSFTKEHSENVTKYSAAIAREMNLSSIEIEHIRRAGLLHDIGKIGIRDGVLLKTSKLNDDEYTDIKRHSAKGEAIVNALPFLKEEAKLIRHHHERFDGAGYPDGLKGDQIERGARILAIADSFDAMVESRIYRKALTLEAACQELKDNSGKQFDPETVQALLRAIEKDPNFINSTKHSQL